MSTWQDELATILAPLNTQAYALYLQTSAGDVVAYQSDQAFPAASLIKLGVAAYIETMVQVDPTFMTQDLLLPENPVAGAGVTYHLSRRTWSVRDLIDVMLTVSDNAATNRLIDACGGIQPIQTWLQQYYPGVVMRRHLMCPADNPVPNTMTASGAWALLHHFFAETNAYTRFIRQCLANQNNRSKLVALVDEDNSAITTFNKTGELNDCENDAARFQSETAWVDCVMLTQFGATQRQLAFQVLQRVGVVAAKRLGELG